MKALPIVDRELRSAARRRGTHGGRCTAAALGLVTASVLLWATGHEEPTTQAHVVFFALSALALLLALLGGVLGTADSVSGEKRNETLGLLFLTPLRSHDVVLGKLVAHSVRWLDALVALLPVLALPLLLGGIAPGVVAAIALTLLNTLFLSLALGLLASVLARDARAAVGGTLGVLAFLTLALPLVRWGLVEWLSPASTPLSNTRAAPSFRWLLWPNPFTPFLASMEWMRRGTAPPGILWTSLAIQHALAWSALVAACLALPRIWRHGTEPAPQPGPATHPSPDLEALRARRSPVLNRDPFAWLILRDPVPTGIVWTGLAVLAFLWASGLAELGREWLQGSLGLAAFFLAALWLKAVLATVATRHLHEHRHNGALELLLCTPLHVEGLLRGHRHGLERWIAAPLGAVLAAGALLFAVGCTLEASHATRWELAFLFVVLAATLILDLHTLARVGMTLGLRSRRYISALAGTVAAVLALPWLLFLLGLVGWLFWNEAFPHPTRSSPGPYSLVGAWAVTSAAVNTLLLLWTHRRLPQALREFAVGRYAEARHTVEIPIPVRSVPSTPA
ncbi:MAG: ABC transporter permease subunit [Verrucomicrobiae bacterium]|nr:ABC transporter permease subunit [Verrucomicrobiae bacterium]